MSSSQLDPYAPPLAAFSSSSAARSAWVPEEQVHLPAAGPAHRWVARSIDFVLFALPMVVLCLLFGVDAQLPAWLLSVLSSISSMPLEAACLARWGSTPGKWLLGLVVHDAQGRRPTFSHALERAGLVLLCGCGMGLPYFQNGAMLLAWYQLEKTETTFWDERTGLVVSQLPLGAWRKRLRLLAVLIFLTVVVLVRILLA